MIIDQERIAADAALAAEVHAAEATLNTAIRKAADAHLDAEADVLDMSVLGRGRCVMVRVSVRRRI